jgi:hypothetical protein
MAPGKGQKKEKSGRIGEEPRNHQTETPEEDRRTIDDGVGRNTTASHLTPNPGHGSRSLPPSDHGSKDHHRYHPPHNFPCTHPSPRLNEEGEFDEGKEEEEAADAHR